MTDKKPTTENTALCVENVDLKTVAINSQQPIAAKVESPPPPKPKR